MRIAFICGFAWEPKSTARTRAFPLAVELVEKGHEVTIFLTPYDNVSHSGMRFSREGVRVVNMPVSRVPLARHWTLLHRLVRAVHTFTPDIIHVFKPKGFAGAACTWLLAAGYRAMVLDCDDLEGWGGWNDVQDYPWLVKEYIDRQEKALIRRVPIITTASRELERFAVKIRRSTSGVFYLPNGGVSRAQASLRDRIQLSASLAVGRSAGPVVFYGGSFDAGEDTLLFCHAAAPLLRKYGATLVFVGDGPNVPVVSQFFDETSEINVQYFPRLSYEQYLDLLAKADIVALPYPDNAICRCKCSVRLVDYLSMGKAVITTAVGQNSEYIVDGVSGILTPPGNETQLRSGLERLLRDAALRRELGQNARQRISEKFSWRGGLVETCLSAYEALTARSNLISAA